MRTPLCCQHVPRAVLGAAVFLFGTLGSCHLVFSKDPDQLQPQVGGDGSETEELASRLRQGVLVRMVSHRAASSSTWAIWKKPSFSLTHGSLAPQIPVGRFELHFRGLWAWRESSPVRLSAFVRGSVVVRIGDVIALRVEQDTGTALRTGDQHLAMEPGLVPVEIQYRSADDGTGRLQLWWESNNFSLEPVPAWQFYLPEDLPNALEQVERQEQGRRFVEQLACARCHPQWETGIDVAFRPAPALVNTAGRFSRDWLLRWLEQPQALHPGSTMPQLFDSSRRAYIERWIVATYLTGNSPNRDSSPQRGDHRMGRRLFISVGCAACHLLPDLPAEEQRNLEQRAFHSLGDRWTEATLAQFLMDPQARYPDGRMPKFPLTDSEARDIAAFLLFWFPASRTGSEPAPPNNEELRRVLHDYESTTLADAAQQILSRRGCGACHLTETALAFPKIDVTLSPEPKGCVAGQGKVRFVLSAADQNTIWEFLRRQANEHNDAPFYWRQRQLERLGCWRCHQRDTDEPPPVEQIGATLGGAWLQRIPYQRTPKLNYIFQRLEASYVSTTLREGVTAPLRPQFTYRMPIFGDRATTILQALAEGDGEHWEDGHVRVANEAPNTPPEDPTSGSLYGPELVGFQGYACISCHAWKGRMLADPDPGAIGPDLTRVVGRVRRWWFDHMLESPARLVPRNPMPSIFAPGKTALLEHLLQGDPQRQKDALWSYFALRQEAPDPLPPPPWLIEPPAVGEPIRVAQIPLHITDRLAIESIVLLDNSGRLYVFDVQRGGLIGVFSDRGIYRSVEGRRRRFLMLPPLGDRSLDLETPLWAQRKSSGELARPERLEFHGFDRHTDGATLRYSLHWPEGSIKVNHRIRVPQDSHQRAFYQDWQVQSDGTMRVAIRALSTFQPTSLIHNQSTTSLDEDRVVTDVSPARPARWTVRSDLPSSERPVPAIRQPVQDSGRPSGPLVRPGYRAVELPVPRLRWGEDAVMPSAVAVLPNSGRVFVASMKLGELWEIENPLNAPDRVRWKDYAHGLFQEAYSMASQGDTLYVLHRRNLTAIRDSDNDGLADQFERVAALPHGVADSYDYGYGLVLEDNGSFVFSFAPYAHQHLPGSGGAVRYDPATGQFIELAFGMRNPVGWCKDTQGNIYFSDNQGEWVATNKLCRVVPGHFYGFPNPQQPEHTKKPFGNTAVWIPYGWAHSINGVAVDTTEGKFGPFAGQFFLAELMFGGAILRADIEEINGQDQGVCFPFWQRGLLGPLCLAFHPQGPLFVGSITEPGWMAQPDRGGMFRIEYTGEIPFEIRTIRVTPHGFRLFLTRPAERLSAAARSSYRVEHFRYEYTGAYGSPELDRVEDTIQEVRVIHDGTEIEIRLPRLIAERVYMIHASGVRATSGEALVHPVGAYTLNVIPDR